MQFIIPNSFSFLFKNLQLIISELVSSNKPLLSENFLTKQIAAIKFNESKTYHNSTVERWSKQSDSLINRIVFFFFAPQAKIEYRELCILSFGFLSKELFVLFKMLSVTFFSPFNFSFYLWNVSLRVKRMEEKEAKI